MTTRSDSEKSIDRVLLVEDVEADRLKVRLDLELMGCVVHDTPSILEAKKTLQHDCGLAMLHLTHEPLRSLGLCRWIRTASSVPIIMLTSR